MNRSVWLSLRQNDVAMETSQDFFLNSKTFYCHSKHIHNIYIEVKNDNHGFWSITYWSLRCSNYNSTDTIVALKYTYHSTNILHRYELEQLERLRSEDTPRRLMITQTIESYWIILDPKSEEDKVKVTNLKNSPNFQILKQTLHVTHLKLLDKMCKYEMNPMSIVEDTERQRFCPQTDRRTDGQTDWQGETSIPPFQLRCSGGYNNRDWCVSTDSRELLVHVL